MTLSIESIRGKISKVEIPEWVKKQFVVRRLASFVLLTAMLPVNLAPAKTVTATAGKSLSGDLTVDFTSASILVSTKKVSTVVPGESVVEREAREKAEADAKAKAEADAKAKAEAEARAQAEAEAQAQAQAAAEAKAKQEQAQRNTVSRESRNYSDPSNFDEIYTNAQAATGVDWRILKAIHLVETGGSGSSSITNHAGSGAQGPMQFMPSTWRRYGVDGNGDGVADINNVSDAIFTAANYLKACGYPDVKKALWGYNPSTAYYNKVMNIAHSLGY